MGRQGLAHRTNTPGRCGRLVCTRRGGSDPTFGHVAVVKEVKDNGTYVEEGYNGNPPPDDHSYYTRAVSSSVPSTFLYLPNQEEKK